MGFFCLKSFKNLIEKGVENSCLLCTMFVPRCCAKCSLKCQLVVFFLPVDTGGGRPLLVPRVPDAVSVMWQDTVHAHEGPRMLCEFLINSCNSPV